MARYLLLGGRFQDKRIAKNKTFKKGDEIETDEDLVAKYGSRQFQLLAATPQPLSLMPSFMSSAPAEEDKKEVLPEGTKPLPRPSKPHFDSMNLRQLQDWALEMEVDLKGAKTRDEVLRVLKAK